MLIEKPSQHKGEYDWIDLWWSYRMDSPEFNCPWCKSDDIYPLYTLYLRTEESRGERINGVWSCKKCRKQFSPVKGTRFERTKICMWKWMKCIYLVEKYNYTIHDLMDTLEVTYKTAWKMKKVALQAIKENDLLGMVL